MVEIRTWELCTAQTHADELASLVCWDCGRVQHVCLSCARSERVYRQSICAECEQQH